MIIASSFVSALPFILLLLACPLMMRGMHGGNGHGNGHGKPQARSRDEVALYEPKQARDELNNEIADRAEQAVAEKRRIVS